VDKTPLRILFVASGTHDPKQMTMMPTAPYTTAREISTPTEVKEKEQIKVGRMRYSMSKLCNILCAYELNRQLAKLGIEHVAVNAFDPGFMPGKDSGLARDYSKVAQFFWRNLMPVVIVFMRNAHTTATSGSRLASLAVQDKYAHVTGKYFEGTKQIASSTESYDEDKARDLWQTSLELCHLTAEECLFVQ
jgi:NAD(P)-dependent dehydrogenase (short-subunit alcohol dehydrogenase family)